MRYIRKQLDNLSEKFGLDAIYAFGSCAKEITAAVSEGKKFRPSSQSDMDIGILPKAGRRLTLKQKVRLTNEIEDLFDAAKCDLVLLPDSDPFIAVQIIRGDRIYCRDINRADEYELYVLRRAGDLIPLENERINLIMART